MSFNVVKFLLLPIISVKEVRKIMLANPENFDKKVLTIIMLSLVAFKQY